MSLDFLQHVIKGCERGSSFRIWEKDRGSLLKEVRIKGFSGEAILFSLDGKRELNPYLEGGPHQQTCDAVLITRIKEQYYIIFIEIKSTSIDRKHIKTQFISTECYLDYCNEILKRFYSENFLETCKKRFVVFHQAPRIHKTKTRPPSKSKIIHDSADQPKYIAYSTPLWIKKLL